ncbi:hypothetical protein VOLCADRAFT_107901 [Volvox carteri f. nagariensis]|uniref:Uncharacterized protein n=1 Tax=Volvox carteri f. nagariensis TaxID=3068 RepID=D8UH34_VOLCA|nr:uncharacterized protein VOLCADRAFT_107901 [Volvox carteri f. nagariensis]EFJ40975.1 hypothetical protein VOLCADRAFT_107901 [Volvox carteri f. nagariensis]|eukprot:XP_002957949.1 hypothetical protein VOLCADRAFT_107901 [Volvox carteri f. nagariensis]
MAPDGALDVDVHGPDKKRQKLAKLAGLGFARDMAEVLVETLGMDPIGQSTDAAIAKTLSEEGLVDLASVKTVAGEVEVNARLADADSEVAIKSLRALAPNLKALQALKLAKAACAPTAQPADELGEVPAPNPPSLQPSGSPSRAARFTADNEGPSTGGPPFFCGGGGGGGAPLGPQDYSLLTMMAHSETPLNQQAVRLYGKEKKTSSSPPHEPHKPCGQAKLVPCRSIPGLCTAEHSG